ncbi:hypothetical protein OSH12_24420, partial [Kaistia terrae]
MTVPAIWADPDGLVERLEIRAAFAREECTATATVDALYFEEAAARIAELEAEIARKDDALRGLTSEVGALGAFALEIRMIAGSTNYACLMQRRD